jgi:hypothetical protein
MAAWPKEARIFERREKASALGFGEARTDWMLPATRRYRWLRRLAIEATVGGHIFPRSRQTFSSACFSFVYSASPSTPQDKLRQKLFKARGGAAAATSDGGEDDIVASEIVSRESQHV